MNTKISIVGAGYVGTSLGVLISSKYIVNLYDLDKHKVDLINKKQSHLEEKDISDWLTKKKLSIMVDYHYCSHNVEDFPSSNNFNELNKIDELKDPKSCLQELIQKKYKSLPRYSSKENTSFSYLNRFEATCYVDEAKLTTNGTAKTRKGAELEAAAVMLVLMEDNES